MGACASRKNIDLANAPRYPGFDDVVKRSESEDGSNSQVVSEPRILGPLSPDILPLSPVPKLEPVDTSNVTTFALTPRSALAHGTQLPSNTGLNDPAQIPQPRVNQYIVGKVVGRGSQGVVRLVTEPDGSEWAMKIVSKKQSRLPTWRAGQKSNNNGQYGLASGKIMWEIAIM